MSTLSLKNINKIYTNNVQAVFDFSLEIKDKEFIVLVGPSGCGKSTTLRMVAGLEDISSGELFIDGNFVNSVVPKDRNIAMVFQNYALYPHMTVYGNMAFALKLRKIPCPVYSNIEDVADIEKENLELYKQAKKLNRRFKKHQDDYSILEPRQEIYNKIYANLAKEKEILKPVFGIDEYQIKHFKFMIDIVKDEIAKLEKTLLKDNIPEIRRNILEASLNQKKGQIDFFNEKLAFYQNNEVEIYKLRKLKKFEIDVEVNKAAESIDLLKYLFRKPSALSGGQRQRVALGRAIVRKPKVFLMDEPLSNLDAKLRVQTRGEILKIHRKVGATTIYVTHDQTEAMTMADRIVVMKDGYIQQTGAPREVYDDPANKFVAGFIGSPAMNFIEGKVESGNFVVAAKDGAENVKIELPKAEVERLKDYEGKDVLLGARPEAIYLDGDVNNTKPSNLINVECEYSELLGYELVIYSYIGGQKLVSKTSSKVEIKAGDKIGLRFNGNSLYFFDKETEKRIR